MRLADKWRFFRRVGADGEIFLGFVNVKMSQQEKQQGATALIESPIPEEPSRWACAPLLTGAVGPVPEERPRLTVYRYTINT